VYITPSNATEINHKQQSWNGVNLMSRVAVMMSRNSVDAEMSSHFGKTEWVMATDTESKDLVFLKNEGMNGKSVIELLASQKCSDAIFTEIGEGALGHLKAANIRGWVASQALSGLQALAMFENRQLQPASSPAGEHSGHGCCCAKSADSATCCG
jgi:predicted Fe-Mo cluster-binding NifX family protein